MRFEKWQALGNDYLIVEQAQLPFALTPGRIARLCEGHFGVGADGVLLVEPGMPGGCAGSLRIFNPDGSEAELSGNGAREAALYMHRHGWSESSTFKIHTRAGEIGPTITGPLTCKMSLGRAHTASADFPSGPPDGAAELSAGQRVWHIQHVSIGNPQCAIHVEDVEMLSALDLPTLGPTIEANERFPNRTNVSWFAALSDDRIRARIFERGVGETLSSGTGAAGAAVAQVLRTGGGARTISVVLDGGELEVEISPTLEISQSGWAQPIFAGELTPDFVAELAEIG
jgi:diaminopimelate epimerase